LEWVHWINIRRLLESIEDIPPAEFEQAYYEQLEGQARAA
jgi:transposase InsO family protein